MSIAASPAFENAQEKFLTVDPVLMDQIKSLAQEIFEQRGGASGSDVSDWLHAEEAILAREEYRKSWEKD